MTYMQQSRRHITNTIGLCILFSNHCLAVCTLSIMDLWSATELYAFRYRSIKTPMKTKIAFFWDIYLEKGNISRMDNLIMIFSLTMLSYAMFSLNCLIRLHHIPKKYQISYVLAKITTYYFETYTEFLL